MADIDIASMTGPQKLAYAQAVGSVLLASAEIASPVSEIILAIPAGYNRLVLDFNFVIDQDDDSIYTQFSTDGGSTYHTGGTDYSTTSANSAYPGIDTLNETVVQFNYATGLLILAGNRGIWSARPATAIATLYPGGDGANASIWNSAGYFQTLGLPGPNTQAPTIEWWYSSLEVTTNRVTHIKLLPPQFSDPIGNFVGGYYTLNGAAVS